MADDLDKSLNADTAGDDNHQPEIPENVQKIITAEKEMEGLPAKRPKVDLQSLPHAGLSGPDCCAYPITGNVSTGKRAAT